MRILSFDGGGIRGVLTAELMKRLEEEFPNFYKEADLLAGTSTGSIIAAGLAMGMSPADIIQFYKEKTSIIFSHSFLHKVSSVDNMFGAKYRNEEKMGVFEDVFGDKKLGDLSKQVMIVSFDLDNKGTSKSKRKVPRQWWPRIFENKPNSPDCDIKVVDALMATSAAPTYWPIYNSHIDGGIKYNNPAMLALTEAIKRGKLLEELSLLSFGTGVNPDYMTERNDNWGLMQWAPHLIKILLSDDVAVNIQAQQLLGERFYRLQETFEKNIEMDDFHKIEELISIADQMSLEEVKEWMKNYFYKKLEVAA